MAAFRCSTAGWTDLKEHMVAENVKITLLKNKCNVVDVKYDFQSAENL